MVRLVQNRLGCAEYAYVNKQVNSHYFTGVLPGISSCLLSSYRIANTKIRWLS
jgi:hypothetical protein